MKNIKYLLLLITVACSSPRVMYDYDTEINFNEYKTFNFFEDIGEGLNKFDVTRISREIKRGLKKQGIKQVERPDFYVNVTSKVQRQSDQNTVAIGIGGGNRGVGYGISSDFPIGSRKLSQQVIIDFVESKNNQLIWQAIVDSEIKENITAQQRDKYYTNIIQKVILGYPPKQEK